MGKETNIPWGDSTFSPWWGCTEVSAECDNCYAREFDARFGGEHWGKDQPRRVFGDKHWNEPRKWNRAVEAGAVGKDGRRWLVFCSSMADVFETNDSLDAERVKLWQLIRETPRLVWLILTKRPQNIGRMLPADLVGVPQIWLGTTVGVRESLWRADALIEHGWRAPVRFLSMEPMLETVGLGDRLGNTPYGVNWVICGSESGSRPRPMQTDWMRQVRDECADAGVPFFAKQADEGTDGISAYPARDTAQTGALAPYRRRDLRLGDDGMKRVRYIIERPYLDGVQHVAWPA